MSAAHSVLAASPPEAASQADAGPAAVALRLFHQGDPLQEIDSRILGEGEIGIGRGQDADWVIPDPTKTLSRLHCVIGLRAGAVTVRDASTNGVFLPGGDRLPAGAATPVAADGGIVLGAFLIRLAPHQVESDKPARAAPAVATLPGVSEGSPAGKLLDAFCGGAQIDSSVLSAEDPTEVMRRLGAIYREMVMGLGQLMNERTRTKARYGLEWTAVQALDNNPFRWAPPQRVAIDLLQTRQDGFLTGEAAVHSSFQDLREHQLRIDDASRAAITTLLVDLAPDTIAGTLHGRGFLMKKKRTEALWAEYAEAHGRACDELDAWAGGSASRAFREAYAKGAVDPTPAPDPPAANGQANLPTAYRIK